MAAEAKAQELKIRVPTLMEKLVPTAQVETALTADSRRLIHGVHYSQRQHTAG